MPASLGEVDLEWCRTAFAGKVDDTLTGVSALPIGGGRMATAARLTLTWSSGFGPDTAFLKLSGVDERSRRTAKVLGTAVTELRFYMNLQPRLSDLAPRCYSWATDGLARSALLLENVAGAGLDQEAGCSLRDASRVAETLATLHARTWDSEDVRRLDWLRYGSLAAHPEAAKLAGRLAGRLISRLGERSAMRVKAALSLIQLEIGDDDLAYRCLVHGDARVANVALRPERVILLDWQTLAWGSPFGDLSYLASTSLNVEEPSERLAAHQSLFTAYIDSLSAAGISVDVEEAWCSYVRLSRSGLTMALVAWAFTNPSGGSADVFRAMAERAAADVLLLREGGNLRSAGWPGPLA